MQIDSKKQNTKTVHQVWLYSVVFLSRKVTFVVLMLFLSFLIQPIHQAFASETELETEPTVLPEEVENQLPDADEPVVEEVVPEQVAVPVVNDEEVVEANVETEPEEEASEEAAEELIDSDAGVATDAGSETEVNEGATEMPDETENYVETSSSTEANTSTEDNSGVATSTETFSEEVEEVVEDTASSTAASSEELIVESVASSTDTGSTGGGGGSDTVEDEQATTTSEAEGAEQAVDENSTTTESGNVDTDSTPTESNNSGINDGDEVTVDTSDGSSNTVGGNNASNTDDLINGETIEDGVNNLVDNVVNEVVTLTRQLVTEENFYQFSRQSCAPVGDGTYHCTVKNGLPIDPDSAVYAEKDEEGDMEIYLRTSKGEVKQLTDNQFDDTSPDVDLASMRVVWQRMIDGRYQIISYDLNERKETQLTFSRQNSMEPKVSKEGIVWQAWDGNDWEILYFDGQFTDQITQNELQDVTPVVEDDYIIWSVLGGNESEAKVYSIESSEIVTITGHEGGAVANPRFVLVYDTKFDNGDVVTQTFDPTTGLAEPIAAKPNELPFDLPESDPVGEVRALIQNKSTQKEKEVVTVPVSDSGADLNLASSSATSTDTLNLNGVDHGLIDVPLDVTPDFELTEYDLVITPVATTTNSDINQEYEIIDAPEINATTTIER